MLAGASSPAWGDDSYCRYVGSVYDDSGNLFCNLDGSFKYGAAAYGSLEDDLYRCGSTGCNLVYMAPGEFINIRCRGLNLGTPDFTRKISLSCFGDAFPPSLSLSVSPSGSPIVYGKAQIERNIYATVSNNRGWGFGIVEVLNAGSFTTRCNMDSCHLSRFVPDVK